MVSLWLAPHAGSADLKENMKKPTLIETGQRHPLIMVPRDTGWTLQSGRSHLNISDDEMAALIDHVTHYSEQGTE